MSTTRCLPTFYLDFFFYCVIEVFTLWFISYWWSGKYMASTGSLES